MGAFVGIVTQPGRTPNSDAADKMVSAVVAPSHKTLKRCRDSNIYVVSRLAGALGDVAENENVIVVAEGRLNDTHRLSIAVALDAQRRGLAGMVAAAYAKWGVEFLKIASGEFSFAIWDKRKQMLICGRDKFGRVPLYYMPTKSGIVFASDFVSFVSNQTTGLEQNEAWVVEYLSGAVTNHEDTAFKGVSRLPPGKIMWWRAGEIQVQSYWSVSDVSPTENNIPIEKISIALEDAVEKRTSDDNVVAMLSGGLDSSTIAIIARDLHKSKHSGPLATISLVFDDTPEYSERCYVDSIIATGGFEPHYVKAKPFDTFSGLERLISVHGAPINAHGALITDQVEAEAERIGFSSVLNGHGGDETISGLGTMRLIELASEGKWWALYKELALLSRSSGMNVLASFKSLFLSRGVGIAPKLARLFNAGIKEGAQQPTEESLLRHEWREHASVGLSNATRLKYAPANYTTERDFQESILSAPLQSTAFEFLFCQFRSRGMKAEFPLWDSTLVEYCLMTPSRQKLGSGVTRKLIRSAIGDRLPQIVANRASKFDFSNFFEHSMRGSRDDFAEIATLGNHRVFDFVDPEAFKKAILDLGTEHNANGVRAARKIWMVLNLFIWINSLGFNGHKRSQPLELPC